MPAGIYGLVSKHSLGKRIKKKRRRLLPEGAGQGAETTAVPRLIPSCEFAWFGSLFL
jgi:hypothetical protein